MQGFSSISINTTNTAMKFIAPVIIMPPPNVPVDRATVLPRKIKDA